jgi:hypothetical protein
LSHFRDSRSPSRMPHASYLSPFPGNSDINLNLNHAVSTHATSMGLSRRSFLPESCMSRSIPKVMALAGPLSADPTLSSGDLRPGLPLPPPELLGKERGPIMTPVRPPITKPVHPKELVHLQPAPKAKPSAIPRLVHPKHLVKLRAVQPPSSSRRKVLKYLPRRSSGESVKQLIGCFEGQQDVQGFLRRSIAAGGNVGDVEKHNGNVSRLVWKL